MKIIVIGATGTIGNAVSEQLIASGHSVIPVGGHSGDLTVNIASETSIIELFEKVGPFDGLICAAGAAYAGPLKNMGRDDFYKGIESKLMGQINLFMLGKSYISNPGFFTLTSGNLAEEAKTDSAGLGLVNGALNGFVINAGLETPQGIRLNVVSPSILKESVASYGTSPGRMPVPAADVAAAYLKTVNENINGQILRVYGQPL